MRLLIKFDAFFVILELLDVGFVLLISFLKNETVETSTFRAPIPNNSENNQEDKKIAINDGLIIRDNLFGSPKEDALRRDFTINALFYNPLDFTVIDHAGGLDDLKEKLIRVIGDADRRFMEDPVRMIRAARFAGSLNFNIDINDFDSICRNKELLKQASQSRMYDEVQKLFLRTSQTSLLLA